jgi:hypothetical protein
MGYRASNARDRDAAAEWRRLPLSERLHRVNWAMLALMLIFAACALLVARHWLG